MPACKRVYECRCRTIFLLLVPKIHQTISPNLKIRLTILLISILASIGVYGQEEKWLIHTISGQENEKGITSWPDSLNRSIEILNIGKRLQEKGYLLARIKEKTEVSDTLYVHWETLEQISWISLKSGNVSDELLVKAGLRLSRFSGKPFNYQEVNGIFRKILQQAENAGYPFAAVKLDSLDYQGGNFSGALNLDFGPFIVFDSLKFTGNAAIRHKFLSNLIQIRPGEPFSQKKVNQAIGQIQNLAYLRWAGEPELSFQNEEATLYLPLNSRRVNSIDGIIGFFPNESIDRRLLLTGQFDLTLMNVGGSGRNFELHWQQFNQASQSLMVSALEPMLFRSPIDFRISFSLLKEDTAFMNRDFRLDFGYRIGPYSNLTLFSRRQAGDLLSMAGSSLETFPEAGDFRFNNYGIGLERNRLDDVLFPKKGSLAKIEFAVGNKQILQNTALPPSLYEDVEMSSLQYYILGSLENHFYRSASFGVYTRLAGGIMDNRQLLRNDLFRLGGLRSIRGFNENHFFANRYAFLNFEPRFYFDTHSYFMIFADAGCVADRFSGVAVNWPIATGAGFSLQTGNGLFNFIYALGWSETQQVSFNLSKIHFGFTGRF
jgi:outer membrane protein assembly factor BamA